MPEGMNWRGSRRRLLGGATAAGAGLAGLALVGCGDDDDNKTPTKAASAAASSPASSGSPSGSPTGAAANFKLTAPVKIGFIASFTGPLATVYAPFVNGANLAIKEINDKGGIGGQQVSLEQQDDQSNPANVPAAALGLVDKKINFCLGPIGSNAISASPTLNSAKIVQFGYSDNPKLSDPKTFPYSFRYVWSPEQSSKVIVDWYVKQGWNKIAVLAENTVYGQTDAPSTSAYMKTLNLTPTVNEYFASGTSDFASLLNKVKDAGTQAIVWWTQGGPEGQSILVSMNAINLKMPIGGIGLYVNGLQGKVSDDVLNSAYGFQWKNVTYASNVSEIPAPIKAYRDKLAALNQLGATGSGVSPFYDMVYHLKAAIEGGQSTDSDKVIAWMQTNPFQGVMANYTAITKDNHTVNDVNQITLGALNTVDPNNIPWVKRGAGL